MLQTINGFKVVEVRTLTSKCLRFKRDPRITKKPRRTERRWAKRPYFVAHRPSLDVIMDNENKILYAHPIVAKRLREQIPSEFRFMTNLRCPPLRPLYGCSGVC